MSRGGARKGAGRPKGWGKYGGEPTLVVRLPISTVQSIQNHGSHFKLPLYGNKVPAGFPSPAEDYIADRLDLNVFLVKNPATTFLVRATGDSMINAGIHENDILIVDRSITPSHGKIIVAAIDGQFTVKRLHKKNNKQYLLVPDNPNHQPIEIAECSETFIWGVVVHVIHTV